MGNDRDQMQVERDNLAEDVALLKQRCVCVRAGGVCMHDSD